MTTEPMTHAHRVSIIDRAITILKINRRNQPMTPDDVITAAKVLEAYVNG